MGKESENSSRQELLNAPDISKLTLQWAKMSTLTREHLQNQLAIGIENI